MFEHVAADDQLVGAMRAGEVLDLPPYGLGRADGGAGLEVLQQCAVESGQRFLKVLDRRGQPPGRAVAQAQQ